LQWQPAPKEPVGRRVGGRAEESTEAGRGRHIGPTRGGTSAPRFRDPKPPLPAFHAGPPDQVREVQSVSEMRPLPKDQRPANLRQSCHYFAEPYHASTKLRTWRKQRPRRQPSDIGRVIRGDAPAVRYRPIARLHAAP